MKTIESLIPGSPAWLKSRSASKAPAMMGASRYQTRSALLTQMATGMTKDVDAGTQRLFDAGHASEAAAREIAEDILCDGLSPVCGESDDGYLTASFDGLTFDGKIGFEHKLWRDDLAAAVRANDLPEEYKIQMDQQILVGGLDFVLFMCSDGTRDKCVSIEYRSTPERAAKLLAAWKQFDADLAAYVPSDIKEMPKAAVVVDLPALFVHAKGEITTHNMDEFGKALALRLAETRAIVLVTDQDFSNAKAAAAKFRETAKAIALSKAQMLAQTETIGAAAIKMDAWAADLNATALQLEKDVKREDLAKKEVMVLTAKGKYTDHIASLEAETKPIRLALVAPNFAEAIKGKSKYTSMQDAVDTMLAGAVIAADQSAKDVREKLAWCKDNAAGYSALFPDLQQIIVKPMEDFALTITSRIDKAKADEAARLDAEREKIRAEEEAKAAAKVKAEQDEAARQEMLAQQARDEVERQRIAAEREANAKERQEAMPKVTETIDHGEGIKTIVVESNPPAAPDDGARIRLGEISERLGFTVTADFIASLGFQPVEAIKAAKLYRESDFIPIVSSLIEHLDRARSKDWRKAA